MDKEIKVLLVVGMMLVFIMVVMGVLMGLLSFISKSETCEDYSRYGFVTEMNGRWYSQNDCLIYMDDGTKVKLRDYDIDIVSIKEPMRKNR